MRTGIRQGTELCALGTHTKAMAEFVGNIQQKGLTATLTERDSSFGDYRTSATMPKAPGGGAAKGAAKRTAAKKPAKKAAAKKR